MEPNADPQKPRWGGHLVQNALALMLSSAGTGSLGVVFWAAAAHFATPANVGRGSAEIAAMTLLAGLSQLSFGTIFDRFLPIAGKKTRAFVTRAYLMVISFAFAIGIVYIAAGFGRNFIPSSFTWRALFVASVVFWTVFVLQDSVLTSLRAARWVPLENILFALAKLALLPAFLVFSSHQGLFLAWTAPVVVAVISVNLYIFRRRMPVHEASSATVNENFPSTRELISLGFAQYVAGLITLVSASIVVLIVIDRLGPVAEAHYYLPALIANSVALLLYNLVTSFLVEGSTEPDNLRQHAKSTLRVAVVILVPCVVLGVTFAPQILRLFGTTYAVHGTTLLRMLLLTLPFSAVTTFYTSFAWLDKRAWWLARRELLSTVAYLSVLITLIGHFGILSVGIAGLVSSALQGLFFLPILIRRYRLATDGPSLGSEGTADPAS